ncbi:hypothetical protein [Nocardia sp. NBC_00416]|uniref:hypothetical protein n=1 Tax=Nocardia sp. NBC_00416 TaxID=2975991 RepID=UPI002E21F967
MHGRSEFGPLPDCRTVSTVFARAAEFGAHGAADFGCPMLDSVAGLVDAHRRMAVVQPSWDDVVLTWVPGQVGPELPEMDVHADPFTGVWEDAQRHILAIDFEAHRVLGESAGGAVRHHEGLGSVFARMAHLYTISFDRFISDGPEAPNRRQLIRAYIAYENLARRLADGKRCLPPLFGGSVADDIGDR